MILGFGGTALLVRATERGSGQAAAGGIAVILGGAVCWALGSVLSQRMPLPRRPLVATAMEMIGGGALLFVASVVSGDAWRFRAADVSLQSFLRLAYLVVIGSWAASTAYDW